MQLASGALPSPPGQPQPGESCVSVRSTKFEVVPFLELSIFG